MSRYYNYELKDHIKMWAEFTDAISGYGFHIANTRLFVLEEMINSRIDAKHYDESEYHEKMQHIIMLIGYAKTATKNEKIIYLFTISEWLNKIIQAIEEREERAKNEREWARQSLINETNEIANRATPPDSMGDIPF